MDKSVQRWAEWAAITASVAAVVPGWIAVDAYRDWAARPGPRSVIDKSFDFTWSFGILLLTWIVAVVAFVCFVVRARRSDALISRGATPGRGLVWSWGVAAVLAVFFGLVFQVYMSFATPNYGMAGETLIYVVANVVVNALAGALALTASMRAGRALNAAAGGASR